MAPIKKYKATLDNTTLIHGVYRSLLNNGRTYAAFKEKPIVSLINELRDHKEILDPMAGYGCLMSICSQSDLLLKTYNIECNPPSYFWQYLIHPQNYDLFIEFSNTLLQNKNKWPRPKPGIYVSDTWFPSESLQILEKLWFGCIEIASKLSKEPEKMALAFLLPFVGRFGSFVQGNIVTHIKPGGICIHAGWNNDFEKYNKVLIDRLSDKKDKCKQTKHTILLADAQTCRIPHKKFTAMITSPPYPNGRDYSKIFAIENVFIDWLVTKQYIANVSLATRLIGSPIVSEQFGFIKRKPEDIQSKSAKEFLQFIEEYKETRRIEYDNQVYYVPYYSNYFYGLEQAYSNIAEHLDNSFEGYIIVINNTARKKIIPVAESVVEIWKNLGFRASIVKERTQELPHIGGLNPRVKGITSRHMEYTIKVIR